MHTHKSYNLRAIPINESERFLINTTFTRDFNYAYINFVSNALSTCLVISILGGFVFHFMIKFLEHIDKRQIEEEESSEINLDYKKLLQKD